LRRSRIPHNSSITRFMTKPLSSSERSKRVRELEKQLADQKDFYEHELAETRAKYRRVLESTSEGYLELDLVSRITGCNETILSILGLDRDDLMGTPLGELYDKKSVFAHFASPNHLSFEANFKTGDDTTIPVLCKRSILRNQEGEHEGYLALLTDLTEQRKAEAELQEARSLYRNMYKNAVQGMYQVMLNGEFLRVNPAFARTFGFASTAELLAVPGGVSALFKNPDDRQELLSQLREKRVIRNFEIEMVRPDGKTVWALVNSRLIEDARGRHIVEGILIDNTKNKLAEEKLRVSRERFRYLAIHDSLTGLFNTRYLYKELDHLVSRCRDSGTPISLVFLDMDNFKNVVDTHGHLNGSQVLKEVAKTLQEGLEEPAFGVAYGGDEFVLVLPGREKAGAVEQVRRIRSAMKRTAYLESRGLAIQISASFGIATFPDDAQDRDSLLALADEALFRIKSMGKDAIGVAEDQES